jgi:hypothetical protein
MLVFASDFTFVTRWCVVWPPRTLIDLLRLANMVDLRGSLRGQVFESRMLDTLSLRWRHRRVCDERWRRQGAADRWRWCHAVYGG